MNLWFGCFLIEAQMSTAHRFQGPLYQQQPSEVMNPWFGCFLIEAQMSTAHRFQRPLY